MMRGSGNFIIDMHEKAEREAKRYDEDYCSDCDHSPCTCDEDYERSRED